MRHTRSFRAAIFVPVLGSVALALVPLRGAHAADVLGLYLGAAAGNGRVAIDDANFTGSTFGESHAAIKALVGIKPIPFVGAELEYVDFGHPRGPLGAYIADATVRGGAAFGVAYLPLPIGAIFVKAGIAHLQSTLGGSLAPGFGLCPTFGCVAFPTLRRSASGGAAGAGVEFKFLSWTMRAEYERFNAAGGNQALATLGVTWTFL